MAEPFVLFTLVILIALTILNLKLTLGLYKIINNPPANVNESAPAAIGELVPGIQAKQLLNNVQVSAVTEGIPTALIFLSSKCPTCKEKLPQIEEIYSVAETAGLKLRIVSTESKKRLRHFLKNSELLSGVVITKRKEYKKLNPSLASPFYLFVDHESRLQTFGTIGDDDWTSFVQQMQDVKHETGELHE